MEKNQTKHILIVDDSPDQRTLLKILLEAKGYTTECTSNGEEALQLLHTSEKLPRTILIDLNMPVMGGLDFRQLQRNDPMLMHIPVIVMSGEENLAATSIKTGSDVLRKPFTISELMETIERNSSLH